MSSRSTLERKYFYYVYHYFARINESANWNLSGKSKKQEIFHKRILGITNLYKSEKYILHYAHFFIQKYGAPYFDPPQATVSFSEGSIIGSRLLLEPAKIPPGSDYIISSYSITGGNEESRFRLHETKGQENSVGTLGNRGKTSKSFSIFISILS